jgi:GT2 family glycosyltransferase
MKIATLPKRDEPTPEAPLPTRAPLQTKAVLISEREIAGHVFDPEAPETRFVVELWLDGYPAGLARANLFDPELGAAARGDGCYRFVFALDADVADNAEIAQVRLANLPTPVGAPLWLGEEEVERPARPAGEARWAGGLRIQGWIPWDPTTTSEVRALIDGEEVARARAVLFSHVGEAAAGAVARGFELLLPLEYADGRVRRVRVVDENDREVPGSPCPVVAFPRGLEQFLEERADLGSERQRAGLFDRLIPQSMPIGEFAAWARAFPPVPAFNAPSGVIAVALIGEEGLDETLESLERQTHNAAIVAAFDAGGEPMRFAAVDLEAFLDADAREAAMIVFAPAGTQFHAAALGRFAEALERYPDAGLVYCDLLLTDAHQREWPLAFPAFDYERLLEQGYAAFCFAARATHVRAALAQGVDDLFRLFNFAFDRASIEECAPAVHAPGFLARLPVADRAASTALLLRATRAHLEARKLNFVAEPRASDLLPAVRVRRMAPTGKVSILIPTRDRVDLLRPCLDSLARTLQSQPHEIFVIDNDSADPATHDYFEEIAAAGVRIAKASGPFNFARLINAGASVADGEYLLALNNDIEATRPGWLEEMLSRIVEPDVGAVGALLTFPGGGVQHGGVVLGPNLAADHAFDDRREGDPGYGETLNVAHETSAVTAACLLTPRALFRQLGGFDSLRYPVLFNDVDYCLRLRVARKRVVFTPHARLVHRASSSRGRDAAFDGRHRHQRDIDHLRMAWAEVLADDPFYSPMLALEAPYAGLAWPPRSQAPRLPGIERPRTAPAGF